MNKYIDSKLTIKKINIINLLAILPLLISGFYKNGIKLYALGLVNIFGLFKPLIFDILGLVIALIGCYYYFTFMSGKTPIIPLPFLN